MASQAKSLDLSRLILQYTTLGQTALMNVRAISVTSSPSISSVKVLSRRVIANTCLRAAMSLRKVARRAAPEIDDDSAHVG